MRSQSHSSQIELWLRLIRADGVGPTLFKRLLDYFGEIDHVLGASVSALCRVEGIGGHCQSSFGLYEEKLGR